MNSVQERFWAKVDKSGECWTWTAATNSEGYGRFKINGKLYSPHRLAWEWENGSIPEGMFICHHCDSPACCNPTHLFCGTRSDNMKDAVQKGRLNNHINKHNLLLGENHHSAKLTKKQVRKIRELYTGGSITQTALAQTYKVDPSTIQHVIARITWKNA